MQKKIGEYVSDLGLENFLRVKGKKESQWLSNQKLKPCKI